MDKKEETSCRRSAVSRLLDFAGPRKALTYLGCTLSAISMVVGFGPYVCIWLVARDLIAVAPNWSAATSIAMYGWWAVWGRAEHGTAQADGARCVRVPGKPPVQAERA